MFQGVTMKIRYKGSLQKTMLIYFILIGFAASVISIEFISDVNRKDLRIELSQRISKLSSGQIEFDEAFIPIQRIANKAILMVGLLMAVVLILLIMFIKNISEPLQHMIEVSKVIAAGDLGKTVNISANNELSEMGNTVNELTSNLQEMILLSKEMCLAIEQFVEKMSTVFNNREIDRNSLENIKRDADHLDSKVKFMKRLILTCKFYEIER